jgi:hypothetical protein
MVVGASFTLTTCEKDLQFPLVVPFHPLSRSFRHPHTRSIQPRLGRLRGGETLGFPTVENPRCEWCIERKEPLTFLPPTRKEHDDVPLPTSWMGAICLFSPLLESCRQHTMDVRHISVQTRILPRQILSRTSSILPPMDWHGRSRARSTASPPHVPLTTIPAVPRHLRPGLCCKYKIN